MKRLRWRRKTRRRLTLAAIVAITGGLLAFGLLGVRKWQINARHQAERSAGLAAFESGERMEALNHLGQYIKTARNATDADVLRAYGLTRAKVTEHDGRHLREAVDILGRYLALRPDDRETRIEMMKLANRAGMPVDARDAARQLRPENLSEATEEHVPILKEEIRAQLGLKVAQRTETERALDRLLELAPNDAEALGQYLSMLQITSREGEARVWAEGRLAKDPSDPNLKLVAALARLITARDSADLPGARSALMSAAGMTEDSGERSQPITNGDYAAMLVLAFDDLKMHQHALGVLRAAHGLQRPDLLAALVRRLWTENLDEELVRATDGIDPKNMELDTDVIAFRAMALKRLGREAESRPLIVALNERAWDYRARGWFPAINAMDASKSANPGELAKSLRAVLNDQLPDEPVVQAWLGDALAANNQFEEARAMWRQAGKSRLSPNWAAPLVRVAESLISENRTEEAAAVATEALQASPNRLLVNVVWMEAHAARFSAGSLAPPTASDLVPRLEELWRILTSQDSSAARDLQARLVPVRIVLLNRAGRGKEAQAAMTAALGLQPPPTSETLRRLASVSLSERLGREDEILGRIGTGEASSPQTIYSKAATFAIAGRPDAGLKLFKDAFGGKVGDSDLRAAHARYLDFIGHPDAAKTIVALGDTYPEVPAIQILCLESEAAASDREFIARTITRYRGLTRMDEQHSDARINAARARMLLAGTPSAKDRDDAITILATLVKDQPETPATRILLAEALLSGSSPDAARAIPHLEAARRLKPSDGRIAIRLARIYQQQQQLDKSRGVVREFLRAAPDNPSPVAEAAAILSELGATQEAVAAMRSLIDHLGNDAGPGVFIRLAELQIAVPDKAGARATIDRLLTSPKLDPLSGLVAASVLRSMGDTAAAEAAMKKAEGLEQAEVRRFLMRARFVMAGESDPGESERLLREALRIDPSLEDAWTQLASLHLGQRNFQEAARAAQDGLGHIPGSTRLGVLQAQAQRAAAGGENTSLSPLIAQMSRDPSSASGVPVLEAVEKLRAAGRLDDPAALIDLGDRFPENAGLQVFVIEKLLANPMPPLEIAAQRAARAMARFPASGDAARLAAGTLARLQRWEDALAAGRAWQQRDASKPVGAEVVIAEAQTRLGQASQAIQTLANRVQPALGDPEAPLSISVLHTYGRALIAAGREAEARNLWRPMLSKSGVYRVRVWLDSAAREVRDAAAAREWINEVQPLLDPSSTEEQLAYAGALSGVALRGTAEQRKALLADAEAVLTRLASDPKQMTPQVMEALAATRLAAGNKQGANEAFAKAIELGGERALPLASLSQNELSDGRPEQALQLAERAIKADPADRFACEAMFAACRALGERAIARGDREPGKALFARGRDALAAAKDQFSDDSRMLGQWALACQLAGDYAGAADAYAAILKQPIPESMRGLLQNNRAYVIIRKSDASVEEIREARALAEAAVKQADTPEVRDTLGWALIRDGQRALAAEEFRKVLAKTPESPSAMLGLAESLAMVGASSDQRREAKELLAKFTEAEKTGKVTSVDLLDIADRLRARMR